jgi:hypothetical protein
VPELWLRSGGQPLAGLLGTRPGNP